jgi:hypothetical protein
MSPFEIDEIAVQQVRRCRRSASAEVVLLEQRNPQAAPGGIARDAHAIEAAPDDRDVDISHAAMISDGHHRESSLPDVTVEDRA